MTHPSDTWKILPRAGNPAAVAGVPLLPARRLLRGAFAGRQIPGQARQKHQFPTHTSPLLTKDSLRESLDTAFLRYADSLCAEWTWLAHLAALRRSLSSNPVKWPGCARVLHD